MASSFGWGFLAAFSLVIGAVIALVFHLSLRVIGLIMAFGAGVLISAVAFDLVQEAADKSSGHGALIAGLFSGCLVFAGGDWLIGRYGGKDRKDRLVPRGRFRACHRAGIRAGRDPGVHGHRPDHLRRRCGGRGLPDGGLHLELA